MTGATIKNIHQYLNEFDQIFGHKRLSTNVAMVEGHMIYLDIVYADNTPYHKATAWGTVTETDWFYEEGQIIKQRARVALHIEPKTSERDELIGKPRDYQMEMRYENFFINSYTMPDKQLADEFFAARLKLAERYDALTRPLSDTKDGVYQGCIYKGAIIESIGERLIKQAFLKTEQAILRLFDDIEKLVNNKPVSAWTRGDAREIQYQNTCNDAINALDTYDFLRYGQAWTKDITTERIPKCA